MGFVRVLKDWVCHGTAAAAPAAAPAAAAAAAAAGGVAVSKQLN